MMRIFGETPPNAPPGAFEIIPAPIGERCVLCEIPIKDRDIGVMVPTGADTWGPQHKACTFLEVARSRGEWARIWKLAARRYRTEREILLEVCREAGLSVEVRAIRVPAGFMPGRGGEPS